MHPDVSDPSLLDAFEDVRNDATPTNWVIYTYKPRSDSIKVQSTGTGDLKEMLEELGEGKVQYCFIRFNLNGTFKFVYIAWCGEGVSGMRRGSFANHAVDMSKFLTGFHVQINARAWEDINEQDILARLKKATGSHGRQSVKARFQGQASEGVTPQSVSVAKQMHEQEQEKSGQVQVENKKELVDKQASEQFWEKQREVDEQTSKDNAYVPQREASWKASGSGDASGGSIGKKWEQQHTQEEQAPTPSSSYVPPQQQEEPATSYDDSASSFTQQEEEPSYEAEAQPQEQGEEDSGQYGNEEEGAQEEEYYDEGGEDGEGEAVEAVPTGTQCKALYDYPGQNEGDLAFSMGDLITVLDSTDPSGWWQGDLNGMQGYFPSNFVELV
ncbi:Actin binding protein [Balamuthia mandrillaris]